MSDNNELVRIHEAEIVEDMPYIPPGPSNDPYDKSNALDFANLIFEGRPRHKSEELKREIRHLAKSEDAAMVRERKIPVERYQRKHPMVEFYNNLLEELAVEIEKSE